MKTIAPEKKQKIINYVLNLMKMADPSGMNETKYKNMFANMTNAQFDDWCSGIVDWSRDFNNDRVTLKLTEIPYTNEIKLDNIKKACDKIGVPLFERIALPFVNPNGEVYWTPTKTLVGYTHVKVLQQFGVKKNTQTIDTSKRDAFTGQVVRDAKNSRSSDMENIGLLTMGGVDDIIEELTTIKADDLEAKRNAENQIRTEGRCSLKACGANKKNGVALNTLDVLFLAAGIKTDLITPGLLLKNTMDGKTEARTQK